MLRCLLCLAVLFSLGCGGDDAAAVRADPWPAADALFVGDPYWLGAGGASSVDLGGERTLWLFAASLIDADGTGDRNAAQLVSNTLAVQDGLDPETATLQHHWANGPASFVPDEGDEWHWPLHGIRVGTALTLLFARYRPTTEGLGFESVSWRGLRISNPDDAPEEWTSSELVVPVLPFPCAGPTTLLLHGGHVHAYCVQESANHDVFLLRWTEADFLAGKLERPEWAVESGWASEDPHALFDQGAADFTVSLELFRNRFVQIQARGLSGGFLADALAVRFASGVEGPFSGLETFYEPAEVQPPDLFATAVRSHPQLTGADLVATYIPSGDLEQVQADPALYYPRFLKLTFR